MDTHFGYEPSSAAASVYSCRPESEFKTMSRRSSSVADTFQELESVGEVVTRFELDMALVSEKLANLNLLLMYMETAESDFEAFVSDNPDPNDLDLKALEFDFLSGFLNSEVRVLETQISEFQTDKTNMQEFLSSSKNLGETSIEMEDMVHDSETSLQQSMDQLLELKTRAAMFETIVSRFAAGETRKDKDNSVESCNKDLPELKDKMNVQTVEHQRHILRMLEKSLERELEFERRVSESVQIEEALTMRLHASEQEVIFAEEETVMTLEKLYEADHSSEILMGISQELLTYIKTLQSNLKGSGFGYQETAERLEAKGSGLLKSGSQLADQKSSMEMENMVKVMKERILEVERRAAMSEAKCRMLIETSKELKGSSEKVVLLEKKLKDTKIKLKQCKSRRNSIDLEEMDPMVVMMVGVAEDYDYYSFPRFQ